MSSCAIEPFCYGVEGAGPDPYPSAQNRLSLCLWAWTVPKPCLKGTTSIAEMRKGAKLLKCYDQTAQHETAAQEGPTLSTADPQASCEAPICLRDAAPRAPAPALPCSLQVVTRQHRSFRPTLSSLPRDGCIRHCCCYWKGENMILEEGGRKVAINEGDLCIPYPLDCCRSAGWYL